MGLSAVCNFLVIINDLFSFCECFNIDPLFQDTWYNPDEFPRKFPKGPMEGVWWAFVSMTTVG